ncbi:MAG: ATP-binding protein [Candidatus Jacksonbacteria bacterium]
MKFYNRKKELEILQTHWQHSELVADVLTGRRRIGKTQLALEFAKGKKFFYFFVGRKSLPALLEEWAGILRSIYPEVTVFRNLDEFLKVLFLSIKKEKVLIIFDEFQNFKYFYPAAFSEFQKHIDLNLKISRAHILFLGSAVSMIEKIFIDKKEPLFGRTTRVINLKPFDFLLISKILSDLGYQKNIQLFFDIYAIFNGIPKYYALLEKEVKLNQTLKDIMLNFFYQEDAPLKQEGTALLQQEFGQDYTRYFDILTYMAQGATQINEIAGKLNIAANKLAVYLSRLEKNYYLIEKRAPVLIKKSIRARYYLKDVFLQFWFRYIYRNLSYIEKADSRLLYVLTQKDWSNFQGKIFEDLILDLIRCYNVKINKNFQFKEVGRFWDRKGEVEIDFVGVGIDKTEVCLGEIKLNNKRINQALIKDLKQKAGLPVFSKFKNKKLFVFTLEKIPDNIEKLLEQENILSLSLEQIYNQLHS